MKCICLVFFILLAGITRAQHSPYFYKKASADNGITNDIHAQFLKRFRFLPEMPEYAPEQVKKDVNTGEYIQFTSTWNFDMEAYLEHSVKYYYDKYLADPSMKKADWDYTELYSQKDNSAYVNSGKSSVAVGFMVFVVKVDGKEAFSFILLMPKYAMSSITMFSTNLWKVDNTNRYNRDNDSERKPTPDEKYAAMKQKEVAFYPLMYYMRDNGTAGSHAIEFEVYPAKINCEKTTDRSNELMCKGRFNFLISQAEIDEMKKAGGPKLIPNMKVYTERGDGFFRF